MQQYPQVNAPQPHTPTTLFCSRCGTQNFYTAKFCIRCGKPFERRPEQETRSSSPPSSNKDDAPSLAFASLFFLLGFLSYAFALLQAYESYSTVNGGFLSTVENASSIYGGIVAFFIFSVVGQAFVSLGFIFLVIYMSKK